MSHHRCILAIVVVLTCCGWPRQVAPATHKARKTASRTLTPPPSHSTPGTAVSSTGARTSGGTNVMNGTFEWTGRQGKKNDLKAVFTPAGPEEWDVTFTFKWDNNPLEFKGKATGTLKEGKVTGTASNNKGRSWRFEARTTSGRIKDDHFETTGGKEVRTGDFSLKRT